MRCVYIHISGSELNFSWREFTRDLRTRLNQFWNVDLKEWLWWMLGMQGTHETGVAVNEDLYCTSVICPILWI